MKLKVDDGYIYEFSDITAKHVVIASGAASAELIPGLQMTTVKGQCMQLDAMGMQLPYTLFHQGCYVVPRPDGTLVVGARWNPVTPICIQQLLAI